MWTVPFNLEAALRTNGVMKAIWKNSSKSNLTMLLNVKMMKKHKDVNYRINTTNADLVEFKWEKVIILRLLLTPRAWRVVLVCPHSISVSVIINYSNMAATSHVKLGFLKSKVNFCWIWTLPWKKQLVLYQLLLRK